MLSQRSVDDTAVEEDLGGVCDAIEDVEGFFVLLVIVVLQGQHPGFDFLFHEHAYL